MQKTKLGSLSLAALAALAALSCTGDPSTPSCKAYEDPAGTDLTMPVVSLRKDVIPGVFSGACAFSSCHGVMNPATNNGVYLGDPNGPTSDANATLVQKSVLGMAGEIAMPFVTPGDPSQSYLMHKMDGDLCTLTCKGSCLAPMPQGSPALPADKRLVVRRWIAQGAKDN